MSEEKQTLEAAAQNIDKVLGLASTTRQNHLQVLSDLQLLMNKASEAEVLKKENEILKKKVEDLETLVAAKKEE